VHEQRLPEAGLGKVAIGQHPVHALTGIELERGEIHEVPRRRAYTGCGDDRTTVGMSDQHGGTAECSQRSCRRCDVVVQRRQRQVDRDRSDTCRVELLPHSVPHPTSVPQPVHEDDSEFHADEPRPDTRDLTGA
jgi:hypothetical protein